MSQLAFIALIGILGGAAVCLQAPLASLLNEGIGILESIFIVHIGGAIFVGIPLLLLGGGKMGQWQNVPWYALFAGLLGVTVLASVIYMVPRIGVAAAIILILSGQLLTATIVDHFGVLGVAAHSITPARIAGLAMVFAGAWITVRA